MSVNLEGKHAIIIGASSGMGKAIAELLLEHNVKISIAARRESILKSIRAINPELVFYSSVNVNIKSQISHFIEQALEHHGQIDFIINTAGVMYYQMMLEANYDEWLEMVNTNVVGLLNILHSALQPLADTKGMLINITSDAGRTAFPGLAVYSGTKAFMEFTLRALRHELIDKGVRVVNIQPGNVSTSLQDISTDETAIEKYQSQHTNEFLNANDIANSVLYAMQQPQNVAVNEILIEPQKEPI